MVYMNLVKLWKASEILPSQILLLRLSTYFCKGKKNILKYTYSVLFCFCNLFSWIFLHVSYCFAKQDPQANVKFGCNLETINKCWKRCHMKSMETCNTILARFAQNDARFPRNAKGFTQNVSCTEVASVFVFYSYFLYYYFFGVVVRFR